jgi:glycosyltransferase involved in cell wall biosynthesis
MSALRVRVGRSYLSRFTVDVGQRNAVFVRRPMTPLARFSRRADAVAPLVGRDFDLVHSVNAIVLLTSRPFIVTFEDFLPRTPPDRPAPWLERLLRGRLLDRRCLAVVAMSRYAERCVRRQHRAWAGLAELERKLVQLYPGVELRREAPKHRSGPLRVLFIGHTFIRKGGPALVRAHTELRRAGVPVETTVVSELRWSKGDYMTPASPEWVEEQARALRASGIRHHERLPNRTVLELLDQADYLVHPTLHDTFGFVALEALASGTPVIATATCALPEVVEDGVCGHLLALDNDDTGHWRMVRRKHEPGYLEAYDATLDQLAAQLVERLGTAAEHGAAYEDLSAGALERVRERFDRRQLRDRLEELYEGCREAA